MNVKEAFLDQFTGCQKSTVYKGVRYSTPVVYARGKRKEKKEGIQERVAKVASCVLTVLELSVGVVPSRRWMQQRRVLGLRSKPNTRFAAVKVPLSLLFDSLLCIICGKRRTKRRKRKSMKSF